MQTKNSKPSQHEKRFQAWLKCQPCCITGRAGVDVHHMYGAMFKHNKIAIGHWACIPLCKDMHQGMDGIHTIGKKRWCDMWGPQAAFWKVQHDTYVDAGNDPAPEEVIAAILDWGR